MQFRHRHGNSKYGLNIHRGDEISLASLPEGAKAIITHTIGGHCVVLRLSEMGLTPGSEIKLLRKCSFHGPIEVEVRGVSLAIGYGLAEKIFVQPVKKN